MKKVNICGLPHTVIEKEDSFNTDLHMGQIDYGKCEITVNNSLTPAHKEETICHEMVHGILMHLGYAEMSQDEQFVQAFGNAIYQGFSVRYHESE